MSTLRIAFVFAISASFLGSFGCGRSRAKVEKTGSTQLHSATVDDTKRKGIMAEDNDPALVALAYNALACASDGSGSTGFDTKCPAYKAWREMPAPKDATQAGSEARASATFVNFIEDPDERVRFLGAKALSEATAYRTDRLLAKRVVAAAAAEKSKDLDELIGDRVSKIDVTKTGLLPDIVDVVNKRRREQPALSLAIVDSILFNNSSDRPTYDFMLSLTRDPETRMRSKAVGAFWVGGRRWEAETCKVWESHLEDADDSIAAHSAMLLGWYHSCSSSYETLLGSLEARVQTKRINNDSDFGAAPGKMCEDKKATPAQKQRGAAISRALASNKDLADVLRGRAIRSVVDCDPKGGKAFVARFKNDKESWIRSAAKDALAAK